MLTSVVWACQTPPYYTQHTCIKDECWYNHDTVVFRTPKAERTANYDVVLNLRYTPTYKYKSISVAVKTYDNKKLVRTDTLSYKCFSDNDVAEGKGAYYKEQSAQLPQLQMHKGHIYTMKIYHIMRLDPLNGISNISINIE